MLYSQLGICIGKVGHVNPSWSELGPAQPQLVSHSIKVEICYLPNQNKLSHNTKLNISSQINPYQTKTKPYFIIGLSGISDTFQQMVS